MSDNLKHPCHVGESASGSPYRCPHCGATVGVTRTSFDDKRDGIPESGLVVITLNDPAGTVTGYATVWKDGAKGYPCRVSWGHRVFVRSSVCSDQYIEEPSLEIHRVLCTVKDTYEAARSAIERCG